MEKLKFELKESMLKNPYFTKLKKIYGEDEARKQLEFLCSLSKHKLEDIPTIINWIKSEKFSSRHGRLLGTKSKAMPDNIFQKLLGACENERIKLLIEYDGYEGPRPHDAVQLKLNDLDFDKHTVTIFNSKEKRYYTLPLNKMIEEHLKTFILEHDEEISKHHNYIFYANGHHKDYLSDRFVKNRIVEILKDMKINPIYAKSKDGRNLYLYGFHSVRGHAATRVYNKTHNLRLTQKVLDHMPGSEKVTMLYLVNDEKELADTI